MKKNNFILSEITKKRQKLDRSKLAARVLFIVLGVVSTVWFLIRVIPKPSRAAYPCMKATAPFASAFVLYLISLTSGTYFLKKSFQAFSKRRNVLAGSLLVAMVLAFSASVIYSNFQSYAGSIEYKSPSDFTSNVPLGEAKGLFPGRVVWTHDAGATNEEWTKNSPKHATDDSNVDQTVVNDLLARGIRALAESNTIAGGWDKLFKDYNKKHGNEEVGYTDGEKIGIKLNLTNNGVMSGERVDNAPQLVYALLDHLVNEVGVAQENITIGDPYREFSDVYVDKCVSDFPSVNYVGSFSSGHVSLTEPSSQKVLKFSDGQEESSLPQFYIDADYLINIPILKSHNSAGITIAAKNHMGSVMQPGGTADDQSASFMHYSLPSGEAGYQKYRHLVDFMGHEHLGGKTLLYIVDGLWGGHGWWGKVRKWNMEPFSNDYPNSLFLAQDPVAIESVCYDFLLEEYKDKSSEKFPYMDGTDDYILQAADPFNWPDDIEYDPEGDGSILGSLGVHEHWNNSQDKEYTRNLNTGNGIELYKVFADTELPDFDMADPADYDANRTEEEPVIDGVGDEVCWQNAAWAPIEIDWFEEHGNNPPSFDENDFSGKYKAVWSPDYLYLLVEITDDKLVQFNDDPLDKYWEDDCVEIFIDPDNSGGDHKHNYNAWAYHTSPFTYDVVDLNENGAPQLFNDHVDFVVENEGTTYTYEYRIKIYDDTYDHSNPEDSRVELKGNTTMGFSLAYCENDGDRRENFIGTISGGFDSWKDASLFGEMNLKEGTFYNSGIVDDQPDEIGIYPNPVVDRLYIEGTSGTNLRLSIFDLSGNQLLQEEGAIESVDVGFLSPGTYILVILDGKNRVRRKFTKSHRD